MGRAAVQAAEIAGAKAVGVWKEGEMEKGHGGGDAVSKTAL